MLEKVYLYSTPVRKRRRRTLDQKQLKYIKRKINSGAYSHLFESIDLMDEENDKYRVYRVVFDIDNSVLDRARKNALNLIEKLKRRGIYYNAIHFSGAKGFHVEYKIPAQNFDNVEEYREFKKKIQNWIYANKDIARIKSLDAPTSYKSKGMIRVVGTRHAKTGLYCTSIRYRWLTNKDWLDKILSYATYPHPPFTYDRTSEKLLQEILSAPEFEDNTENVTRILTARRYEDMRVLENDGGDIYRGLEEGKYCVKFYARAISTGLMPNPPHQLRFIIANDYMFHRRRRDLVNLFRHCTDFNERETLYYCNYVGAKYPRPLKCSTIRRLYPSVINVCRNRCPYYHGEGS